VADRQKRLAMKPYKFQNLQHITDDDKEKWASFANDFLELLDVPETVLQKLVFGDKSTFHLNGCVSTYNVCISCNVSKNSDVSVEYVRDSLKLNMFCVLSRTKATGPFFSSESKITGIVYLDMG
jgi:hypothetical protein